MLIALKPIETESTKYEWVPSIQKYAIVGKSSECIHMIFAAHSINQAFEVLHDYEATMQDAGYNLMMVDQQL